MGCISLKLLLSLQAGFRACVFLFRCYRSRECLHGAEVLVMVCCVSSESCDNSNFGVIYRPLDKQASLPQPVNSDPTDCSQTVVWGLSRVPKRLPEDPSAKWESFIWLLFHSGGDNGMSENERSEVWVWVHDGLKFLQCESPRCDPRRVFKGKLSHKALLKNSCWRVFFGSILQQKKKKNHLYQVKLFYNWALRVLFS